MVTQLPLPTREAAVSLLRAVGRWKMETVLDVIGMALIVGAWVAYCWF